MSGSLPQQYDIGNAFLNMAKMGQMGLQNAQTAQDMRKNNLLIQQALAQQAAGQDYQKSFDPSTGQFSQSGFNKLLASDPRAAFAAQSAAGTAGTNQSTVLANQNQQQVNGFNHLKWAGNLATAYSLNPPSVQQIRDDQIDGINAGLQTPSDAAMVLSNAPLDLPPAQQKAAWANHALRFNAAAGQIAQTLPVAQPYQGPGGVVLGQSNPMAPGYTGPGTTITAGAAPTTPVVDPNDPTKTTYLGNAPPVIIPPAGAPQASNAPSLPPLGGVAPGALGAGTYSQPAAGTGQMPGQPQAPAAPSANPLAGQLTTAPLGTGTLATALAQSSANLVTSATAVQPLLSSAQSILTNLKSVSPGFNGGAAAPDLMKLASTASSLGINVDSTGLADYQVFNKLVSQLANSAATGGAVDPSTDARLEAIANANPTAMMSPGARSDAIATVQGALSAKSAYYNGALQYAQSQPGIPPTTLALNYARQWSKQYPNTTAFQFPFMTKPQQEKVYASMSTPERAALRDTAANAIAAGYFTEDAFINGGQ